jgi:negative regulator of sigma E activity
MVCTQEAFCVLVVQVLTVSLSTAILRVSALLSKLNSALASISFVGTYVDIDTQVCARSHKP